MDSGVREDIMVATHTMLAGLQRRKKFKTPRCEGFVQTKMESATIGGTCGVVCTATIAYDEGETNITYLIKHGLLADMERSRNYREKDVVTGRSRIRVNPIRDHQRRN